MAESYEGFYSGGGSSFDSEYSIGFKMSGSQLGFPGSAQTANQLGETVNAVKHGAKTFEVTMVDANASETIPRQHFDEMRALMKLTGIKPSVHAPIIDAAGFGEQGWTADGRADNERRLFGAIEKAQGLDPSGNLPIVLHASNGAPGTEWRPGDEKLGEKKYVIERTTAINQDTGQAQPIKREFKFRPEMPELLEKGGVIERGPDGRPVVRHIKGREAGKLFSAEGSIEAMNNGEWSNKLTEVAQMSKHVNEIIGSAPINLGEYENMFIKEGTNHIVKPIDGGRSWEKVGELDSDSGQVGAYEKMRKASLFMENAELSFISAFGQAYKYGTPEQKKKLKKLSENYSEASEGIHDVVPISRDQNVMGIFAPVQKQLLIDKSIQELQKITRRDTPGVWKMGEDFAKEKAAKTFGNLAARSYDKFGDKAPVLAVENMFQGMAFSRAEDMKDLVEKSRENFVEHLIDKGVSKSKAKKLAEDKLGVTWDVGHLNVMRKKGFTEKDVVEQTKIISKDKSMVKHIHLTDNFGYADTHLAPGMGNVPIKAILEELEKTGRFDEMRKIVEAPSMIQHFKVAPHSMTLAAFGSGIYGMKNGPTWDQAFNLQGNYFGGYGNLNPQTHHTYFGAGFTTMPVELGGQMAGGQSRFGGAPMA
ncbi:sugar phosphate isomerase/epimerase [archaeon]|jgi:sugar phosphate isomerase/epimerase|nr:sugar phosphate isomerase/epimerase [archaeon]MBT7128433.1 sugar phosphate isomerase/epimerase [archaeon]